MNQILKTQTLALIFFCFLVGSISFKLNQAQTIYQTPQVIINIITAGNGGNSSYPQNASLAPNAYYAPIQFPVPTTGQPSSTPGTKYLNNIDYLARSYDMFQGNPHFTREPNDPGIGLRPIFDLTYKLNKLTSDRRYYLPDHVTGIITESCGINTNTQVITGEESYSKSLKVDVGLEVGVTYKNINAGFKASSDFQEVSSNIYNYKQNYLYSSAKCSVYTVLYEELPPLSSNFIKDIRALPERYNSLAYCEFLDKYGTHYFSEMVLGARYGYQYKIKAEEMARAKQKNLNINLALSIKAETKTNSTLNGTVSAGYGTNENEESKFGKLLEDERIISVGSRPPADKNPSTWAEKVYDNPAPVQFKLRPIFEIVTAEKVPMAEKVYHNPAFLQFVSNLRSMMIHEATGEKVPMAEKVHGNPASMQPVSKTGPIFVMNPVTGQKVPIEVHDNPASRQSVSIMRPWNYYDKAEKVPMAERVNDNPAPVLSKNTTIFDHVTAEKVQTQFSNLTQVQINIKYAVENDYCKYLVSKGQLVDCNALKADVITEVPVEKIVKRNAKCTLCTKCGSDFTEDGGAISLDADWAHKFSFRGPQCSGDLSSYSGLKFEGVRMCCEKETQTVIGGCRFCTSCGLDYRVFAGSLKNDQEWENWNSIYPASCQSDMPIVKTKRPIQLCCKDGTFKYGDRNPWQGACKLCHTCGGTHQITQGQLLIGEGWKNFFSIEGEKCNTNSFRSYDYWNYEGGKQVSFCCQH
jgi:hypothetical protein